MSKQTSKQTCSSLSSKSKDKKNVLVKSQNVSHKSKGGFVTREDLLSLSDLLKKSKASQQPKTTVHASLLKSISDIPFVRDQFHKGTQTPTIRVYFTPTQVLLGAVTPNVLNWVFTVRTSSFDLWTEFANLFLEYRPLRAMIEYVPYQQTTTSITGVVGPAAAHISYTDVVSSLTSYSEVVPTDTSKWFVPVLLGSYGETKMHVNKWPVKFDFVPDQQWFYTTDNIAHASWRSYGEITGASSTPLGFISGWVDVQFRGLANI